MKPIRAMIGKILFREHTLKKMKGVQISNKLKIELIKQKIIKRTLIQFPH